MLVQLESPFQLQEHLKALYHTHTRGPDDTTTPITRQTALNLSTPPTGIDRPLWLYELCRFLTMKANNLIIAFFADTPSCSATTCPEMRASEWQYLCAVHDPPKSCCAIDYCCHTLDWAANILTSPKYFPSRLTLGGDMGGGGGGSQASMRHLTNIFRRVYRIFAHAWFQHRGVFWQVEGHEGLYVFFKTVCDVYQLIPEDNYTIPNEAEGGDSDTLETPVVDKSPEVGRMSLLKKHEENGQSHLGDGSEGEATTTVSTGATTRRHKHTPSTGSHVTTIAEGPEEEEPSSTESEGKTSPEQSDPPRGRPMPSGEDTIANGLGKLSLGDLDGEANRCSLAQQPTPQPQNAEKNPMDEFGKNETASAEAESAVAGAAAGVEGEGDDSKKDEVASDTDDGSEDSSIAKGSGVETDLTAGGKEVEENSEDDRRMEIVEDDKEEKIEAEKKGH
jgi:Mob1/phocein family